MVTIDPWPRAYKIAEKWRHLQRFAPDGYFDLFRHFTHEWRERLLPLRMYSGPGLVELFRRNIVPDMIYLDGDHTFHAVLADLVMCVNLFPDAVITGDDWLFDPGLQHTRYMSHVYPVQTAVRQFCHVWGFAVETHENSYCIVPK